MNRKIKFRGKTNSGVWIFGNLVYSENIQPAIYFEVGNGKVKSFDWAYVIPDSVGQYTGQEDKNGKEIYEGDIVKGEDSVIGKVEWINYCWDFGQAVIILDIENGLEPNTLEVIGNIYEQPELLK